jgi:hypothetical protein
MLLLVWSSCMVGDFVGGYFGGDYWPGILLALTQTLGCMVWSGYRSLR